MSRTAAQRYVDNVVAAAGGGDSFTAVLYHCLAAHPDDLMLLNGYTGEQFSNGAILSRSVRVARALQAEMTRRGPDAWRVVTVAPNSQHLLVGSVGALLAGAVPLGLDPSVTVFEMEHFFSVWPPSVVLCAAVRAEDVRRALATRDTLVVGVDEAGGAHCSMDNFIDKYSGNTDTYKLPEIVAGRPALVLPTSGSTGAPKAALITHRGLVAQLPTLWMHHTEFPRPVSHAMLLSSAQWMTWWTVTSSALAVRTAVVMSPVVTPTVALQIIDQHQIPWVLLSPPLAARLLSVVRGAQLRSLRACLVTGGPVAIDTLQGIQDKLSEGAWVRQGYGMTELHGFFSVPHKDTPLDSVGEPSNIFQYKIVGDEGEEKGIGEKGELHIKSDVSAVVKGYHNDEQASRESVSSEGWLRTGDVFRADTNRCLYFVERKKFWFKHNNFQVSPEEVEQVIASVEGVELAGVADSGHGAAAAVVSRGGVTRDQIHRAVNGRLAEYKHLHGGIAFVPDLPLTYSGKLDRRRLRDLVLALIKDGQCHA